MPRIKMVCRECGGDNVKADAFAVWSVLHQEWQVESTFDKGGYCEDCDGECRIDEEPIDEAQARAEEHGCYIGHDLHGWYIADESEAERDEAGPSVGFDGRPHFATKEEAADALDNQGADALKAD